MITPPNLLLLLLLLLYIYPGPQTHSRMHILVPCCSQVTQIKLTAMSKPPLLPLHNTPVAQQKGSYKRTALITLLLLFLLISFRLYCLAGFDPALSIVHRYHMSVSVILAMLVLGIRRKSKSKTEPADVHYQQQQQQQEAHPTTALRRFSIALSRIVSFVRRLVLHVLLVAALSLAVCVLLVVYLMYFEISMYRSMN